MAQAPATLPKPFSSLLSSQAPAIADLKPRERTIDLGGNNVSTLEICNDKILLGFRGGSINIFSSKDLRCETVIEPCRHRAAVSSLRCTCIEIIAGYVDGSVCVWDIQSQEFTDGIMHEDLMRDKGVPRLGWTKPYVIVAKNSIIGIYVQGIDGLFHHVREWDSKVPSISSVDVHSNTSCIIVHSLACGKVHVFRFNGNRVWTTEENIKISVVGVHYDHVVVTRTDGGFSIRIYHIKTGRCVKEIKGHAYAAGFTDDKSRQLCDIVASSSPEEISVWSLKTAVGPSSTGKPTSIPDPHVTLMQGSFVKHGWPRLGSNFLVVHSDNKVSVVDFGS